MSEPVSDADLQRLIEQAKRRAALSFAMAYAKMSPDEDARDDQAMLSLLLELQERRAKEKRQ